MGKAIYVIDEMSNSRYYIILKNGRKFMKISKSQNSLEDIKKVLEIE